MVLEIPNLLPTERMLKRALSWIGRNALLFALVVAALLAIQLLKPSFDRFSDLRRQVGALQESARTLPAYVAIAVRECDARVLRAEAASRQAIDERIEAARLERDRLRQGHSSDLEAALAGGAKAVIENRKRRVRIALLTREIEALDTLRATLDVRRPGESLRQAVSRQTAIMRAQGAIIEASQPRLRELGTQNPVYRAFSTKERTLLAARIREADAKAKAARSRAIMLIEGQRRLNSSKADAKAAVARVERELNTLVQQKNGQLSGSWWERLRIDLAGVAGKAALIVLAIILAPYLIRIFLYHVLAPIAERRPPIRLLAPGTAEGNAFAATQRSAISLDVRLEAREELLVRQGFLQSSSRGGSKATRWLLDQSHPLSSIAAGLIFLTRIRGEGERTVISAVEDPFAEVAMLVLPEGSACVIHPRALAAVVKEIDRGLRITSHWRLTSLFAWLTLQLRFLVFHGPARLILRGGRGVRIEAAERGRIFAQDQLVGFNADLAYSVIRTETFAPYLFGRESLLKDKVEQGHGILIVEEAPRAGPRSGLGRGLEGAFDALLKVVGI